MRSTRLKKHRGYTLQWSYDLADLRGPWSALESGKNIFLTEQFLSAVQHSPPVGSRAVYSVIMRGDQPIARIYSQLVEVDMIQSLSIEDDPDAGWIKRTYIRFRRGLSRRLHGVLLSFGHLLLSGERGIEFADGLDAHAETLLIQDAAIKLHQQVNKDQKVIVVLVKDMKPEHEFLERNPLSCQFSDLKIPEVMSLDLRGRWSSFDDYLADYKSKYRVRVRKAFKRSEEIDIRPMSVEQLREQEHAIYGFYKNIAGQAGFNLCQLRPDYFTAMKDTLRDRFRVYGLYAQDELVGFYSSILGFKTLEAHYLGYDLEKNRQYDLYLTILLRLIEEGIAEGVDDVFFARTAQEIKSSVGAKPVIFHNYLRHRQILPNQFIPLFLKNLVPDESYQLRSPFKVTE